MHVPDGFLTGGTAAAAGVVSAGAITAAMRATREQLSGRQAPLAGIAAAFVFAAQMVNFPVAAGTTGHLLGGALVAVLLGPATGALVVTVVVVVQALAFADGGLTALGVNVLNMAVVTSFGGYAAFVVLRRLLPANRTGVTTAAGIAAGLSVVMSSVAFSIEWLFGASAPVAFDRVFSAMVGVHALIGVGEGVLTGLAVGAVLAVRPDLVHGAADLDRVALGQRTGTSIRAVLAGGAVVALVLAAVVSQFAADDPDGLERVAEQEGFIESAEEHDLSDSLFADYATRGLGDEATSLAVAGITGTIVAALVGAGLVGAVRGRRREGPAPASTGASPNASPNASPSSRPSPRDEPTSATDGG